MTKNEFTKIRKRHLYYPFAARDEWELVSFLLHSHLSMAAMDHFLKLKLVSYTSEIGIYSPYQIFLGNR